MRRYHIYTVYQARFSTSFSIMYIQATTLPYATQWEITNYTPIPKTTLGDRSGMYSVYVKIGYVVYLATKELSTSSPYSQR